MLAKIPPMNPTLEPLRTFNTDDERVAYLWEIDLPEMLRQPTFQARFRTNKRFRKRRPILIIDGMYFRYDRFKIINPANITPGMSRLSAPHPRLPVSVIHPAVFLQVWRGDERFTFRLKAPLYDCCERESGRMLFTFHTTRSVPLTRLQLTRLQKLQQKQRLMKAKYTK